MSGDLQIGVLCACCARHIAVCSPTSPSRPLVLCTRVLLRPCSEKKTAFALTPSAAASAFCGGEESSVPRGTDSTVHCAGLCGWAGDVAAWLSHQAIGAFEAMQGGWRGSERECNCRSASHAYRLMPACSPRPWRSVAMQTQAPERAWLQRRGRLPCRDCVGRNGATSVWRNSNVLRLRSDA